MGRRGPPPPRTQQHRASPQVLVGEQVPSNRRAEIERFLGLFGYRPERTILQVHEAGSFGKGAPRRVRPASNKKGTSVRCSVPTFTVVGRTHDPSFLARLVPPTKEDGGNPGYKGYLFAGKDEGGLAPHELLPLDFVPNGMVYPGDWKEMFGTPGYLVTLHVPSHFGTRKNELLRRLRRIGGAMDVKKEWTFFDELEEYAYKQGRGDLGLPAGS
jgi:hypothetical protein